MSNSKKVKEEFPHSGFPYRLEHKEGKDNKICFFQCEQHMKKYIERHKFKKKDYKSSVKSEND
jgi:predicted amidophosphoribosyltransferase